MEPLASVLRPFQINFLFPVLCPHLFFVGNKNFHYSIFFHYFPVILECFKGSQIDFVQVSGYMSGSVQLCL